MAPAATAKDIDKFNVLTARKERLWQRLQTCHDMIATLPAALVVFKARVAGLDDTRDKFNTLMDEFVIMRAIHEDFNVNVLNLTTSFDDLYFNVLCEAGKYAVPQPLAPPHPAPPETTANLPVIHLSKFDGSYETFPAFIALYNTLIHDTNLPDIKKFSYLLGYVEKGALQLLKTVTFSSENYVIAYQLLVKRYTNKRLIANHYLSAIFSLKPLRSDAQNGLREVVSILHSNVASLKSLGIRNLADYILTDYSLRLLDLKTRKHFESRHLEDEFPTFDHLIKYLRDQSAIYDLSTVNSQASSNKTSSFFNEKHNNRISMGVQNVNNSAPNPIICPLCTEAHRLKVCPNFLSVDPHAREEIVKKLKRCFACLGSHNLSNCSSKFSCMTCGSKRHNTMLHFERSSQRTPVAGSSGDKPSADPTVSLASSCSADRVAHALLGTAQAHILSASGQWQNCRLILDPGSQVNFISTALTDRLRLPRRKCPYELKGVGQTHLGRAQGLVNCSIASLESTVPMLNFQAVVLPRITTDLPTIPVSRDVRDRFSSLDLADPAFHKPAPIDLLLGVDSVLELTPASPVNIKGTPTAVLTNLGWVIMGALPRIDAGSVVSSMFTQIESLSLNDTLQSFWECEEVPKACMVSPEDKACEKYFRETTTREPSGRYITRLPFKDSVAPTLGCNRDIARKRFLSLEIRFQRDPVFRTLYCRNIQEYVTQGQLIPVVRPSPYILTHHGVLKADKIRVVFNPAEKDLRGLSLNDTLMSGPKLQSDIADIITRFRLPRIALVCDIRQMFRAIALHPADRRYQHIFWRFSPEDPVQEWEHTRVIFGATCSPFLAQRTIQQLVMDEGSAFPLAARALESSIYVDDILTGADSESNLLELRDQLIELLGKGGFELGKWASSSKSLKTVEESTPQEISAGPAEIKVLGLIWDPQRDVFSYKIQVDRGNPTKRAVLSRIARTYDVNGYLSPVVFSLKALMQQLWLLKIDWDDPLPGDVADHWEKLTSELPLLEEIAIPRCIVPEGWVRARLIGFSDASSLGMAAVVYLRVQLSDSVQLQLLAAKTRVAPLKGWTIPRLELGAACLLSKLVKLVRGSLASMFLDRPVCFTDSSTTLAWINTPPYQLKTFVANRVAQIHEQSPDTQWRHVPGKCNPADAASRGLFPSDLLKHALWWNGPQFIYEDEQSWPNQAPANTSLPELKGPQIFSHLSAVDFSSFTDLFERVSSLLKLQRVIAYVKRFVHNCLSKTQKKPNDAYLSGPLAAREYSDALDLIIRVTQRQHLGNEIGQLENQNLCSKRYRPLSPFLSPRGFVMVGGRLRHGKLPQLARHPYLIPRNSRLASLLVDHFHLFSGHGGPQLVQSLIQRQYWITSARDLIRRRIFQCLTCYRFKAPPVQPPMSDLPSYRVQPSRCFTRTGVDFAGPFLVKASLLRTTRSVKCYLALFVCMVTKAIHLEAVTALTTDAFLAAMDRFIARRGLPSHMHSDQGSNFRGAAREIAELTKFLANTNESVAHYLASRNIAWHFNPPYAPNFGGLWESGVKSAKHHFKRMIGTQTLSFEEFSTVLTRIEGILNSRPLCPISNSPDDGFDYLTPGHFLTGGPLLARPEVCLDEIPENRLSRWQLTRHLVQSFWRRWTKEYLHTQMCRPKWVASGHSLNVGDVVFWYSPSMLPTQWPMGRITHLLPGDDGVARVVRIRTGTGDVTRPANKVVPLPPA